METIGQFVLFCLGLYTTFAGIRITSLTFRYWVARRIIKLQLEKAVDINVTISPRDKVVYDIRTEEIVEQVVIQMCRGLKFQREWMIRHAISHMALLYQTDVWLSIDPSDKRLYEALDVLKQKFYFMHGTFQDISKSRLRNNIKLDMYTTSGVQINSPEEANTFSRKEHGGGCRIKVVLSIVTPLTSRNYVFLKYL